MSAIVLFTDDHLRLHDNLALQEASRHYQFVYPLYIDEQTDTPLCRPLGAAARWWRHYALSDLSKNLAKHGNSLTLYRGNFIDRLSAFLKHVNASSVYWNRRYLPLEHPDLQGQYWDDWLAKYLQNRGVEGCHFAGKLLYEPCDIRTNQGNPFKVFTPFFKNVRQNHTPRTPLTGKLAISNTGTPADSLALEDLALLPKIDWAAPLRKTWVSTEDAAYTCLENFAQQALAGYHTQRDIPSIKGTSCLSPYLASGQITPAQILAHIQSVAIHNPSIGMVTLEKFIAELHWREFCWHLLYHFPYIRSQPFRPEFTDFPWQQDKSSLHAWQKGKTGIPIVDAGMGQLWQTGWMHNRVRMIVASFLTKHLLIPWQAGEAWFWDTLVDADPANNIASWQWVAGCGADAAPYFRIFNPVLQSKKFDPQGTYLRHWLPSLQHYNDTDIHQPWQVGNIFATAYPQPIIDLAFGRQRALEAYQVIKK